MRHATEELEAGEYTPMPRDGWEVSTPAQQGLDPELVAELHLNANDGRFKLLRSQMREILSTLIN